MVTSPTHGDVVGGGESENLYAGGGWSLVLFRIYELVHRSLWLLHNGSEHSFPSLIWKENVRSIYEQTQKTFTEPFNMLNMNFWLSSNCKPQAQLNGQCPAEKTFRSPYVISPNAAKYTTNSIEQSRSSSLAINCKIERLRQEIKLAILVGFWLFLRVALSLC